MKRPPAINGFDVYRLPEPSGCYVIGADPAEGNPNSDASALVVLNQHTGEECASLAGQFDPTVFAMHIDAVGQWYNRATVMVERGNHGHAVIMWLHEHSYLEILKGHDDKPGWLSSMKGKALLYTAAADAFREQETILHSFATFVQLSSIEGNTLRAPDGQHDDRADAYALALAAPGPSVYESRGIIVIGTGKPVRERKPLALLTHQEAVYEAPGDVGWECEDDDD